MKRWEKRKSRAEPEVQPSTRKGYCPAICCSATKGWSRDFMGLVSFVSKTLDLSAVENIAETYSLDYTG